MKTVGNKIKELRRAKGLSQQKLAESLGVTSQAVSKWETDSSLPEMTMLPDIATFFGVQIDDLFEYSTEKRYQSIATKMEFGKILSNAEFENEEAFLIREAEADPENHQAISLLADLYRYQASLLNKKAVRAAKKALELDPDNKGDINNISLAQGGKLHDWAVTNHHELIEELYRILRAEPKNKKIYWYLLDNLVDDGRLNEAKEVLAEAQKNNPNPRNEFYTVFIKEHEEGFEKTIKDYEKLVEKYSNEWQVLSLVANTYSHHEFYEKALVYWQMTFDCMPKPRYTDPYESMALCCIRMNDYKNAIVYYKKQLELLRTDWNAKYGSEVDAIQERIKQLQER
jgi:transcriptional regulator with XRE-family HTH domain